MGHTKHRGVIGIDPGKTTGWAMFCQGKLIDAHAVKDGRIIWPARDNGLPGTIVVIEIPRVYPFGGKGDPNDLIDLAVLAGEYYGHYRRAGFETVLVPPRTWKGSVPKPIHNERVLAQLTPAERDLLPRRPRAKDFDHNMIDAIGLGLWQLGKEGQR